MEKDGEYISLYNGEETHEHGGHCQIIMNPYGGDSSISIDSAAYFAPVAHLDDATKEVNGSEVVYELTSNGKRPGGSACGDWDKLLRYKKLVRVQNNKVSIEESYRCLLGGASEVVQGCKIN